MKSVFLAAAVLIASGGWAVAQPDAAAGRAGAAGPYSKRLVKVPLWLPNGKRIDVEVVDTPPDREVGLMFRRKLAKDYGMLFVFPQPMGLQFWMKNTWVSLDIVYVGEDKTITRIHRRVRPSTTATSDQDVARVGGYGLYVLEFPAGTADKEKLALGQKLKFGVAIPDR